MSQDRNIKIEYDIKIYRVLPSDFGEFRIFDPLDRLDMAALPGTVVLGAVNMEDKKDPEPAGLLIATEQEDRYILEWLAVSPYYRNQKVGEELLDMVFSVSAKAGLPFFSARCTREIINTGDDYFKTSCFEIEEETGRAYRLPIKNFFQAKNLPYKEDDSVVFSIKDLKAAERDRVMDYVGTARRRQLLSSRPLKITDADQELSSVWIEDGEVHGALFILSRGKRHYPVLVAVDTEDELNILIVHSITRAKALKLDDDDLIVLCPSRHVDHVMQGYVGTEKRFYRKLLTADVSEYPGPIQGRR